MILKSREWFYIVSMYKYYQFTLFLVGVTSVGSVRVLPILKKSNQTEQGYEPNQTKPTRIGSVRFG